MRPTFARVAEMIWPKLAAACLASILAVPATPTPGLAQNFLSFLWDEGGAREVVPFHPRHMPGQIIVSFGDRRLYWVHRRGEAISYPIAIPREKSRWAGVTRVSDKRVNPAWTPTAEMRGESALTGAHAGRSSAKPSGRQSPLSRRQHVSHSRNRRALDHWHGRIQGLHSTVQSRRARPLPARASWNARDGDSGSFSGLKLVSANVTGQPADFILKSLCDDDFAWLQQASFARSSHDQT